MDEIKTLIFRTDRLGDFIISCPFIISYKNHIKPTNISVIASEYNFDYIKRFNFIDNVVPLKNETKFFPKLFILFKLILLLRKIKFDKIIVLDGKKRSFFISLFLRGKKYILLQSRDLEIFSKIFGYTYVINYEIQNQLKNFSFLASLFNFNISNKHINIYKDYKFDREFKFENKYIIIHLDEKWFTEHYYSDFTDINPNISHLDDFINKLLLSTKNEFDIIITSGAKKLNIHQYFLENFKKDNNDIYTKEYNKNKVKFIPNTTFNHIENLIKDSSFLICCEGGVSHVSHNFGINTIAFYEKNRLQHMRYWTEHMPKLHLYERKKMSNLLNDKNFFLLIKDNI